MARKTAHFNAPDLHVHSNRSLYDGMGGPKDVVARGVELGWGAVALTEHGWMGSAPALYQAAKAAKIKPILGCEMYVATDDAVGDESKDDARRHLTVLALSKEGYQNLIAWINESMTRPSYYNGPRISIDRMVEVAPHPLHHNVVMSGCMGGELCQAIVNLESGLDFVADTYINTMREVFPNFYIELHDHSHSKFLDKGFDVYDSMIADQTVMRDYLLKLAQRTGTPVIVANDSHYQSAAQRTSHIAMMARKDSKAKKDDSATSYAMRYQYQTCYMQSMERIAAKLPPWAEKQSLESIHAIVEEANIVLEPLDKETHSYTMPRCGYDDPLAELRKRAKARLKSLAAVHDDDVVYSRFEFELSALGEFASYIILYSDIVRMARSQGIYSWTRGSAANSLVCFCVGIHNIDPIHYKLLFERFVNPARKKLPDIDIDFEGYRRIDVVKMVFEHMVDIEGPDNVRIVSAESTTSNRNAFRLMAAAKGVPQERIDELAKLLPQMIDSGMATDEEEAYQLLKDEYPDLHELAESVFDAPSNITQHACALALGTEERPLNKWVPNHLIGSSNSLVTSYNMKYIEELGFMKLDLLRLDTLSIMHDIARMLGKDMVWLDDIMRDGPGSYGAEDDDVFTMLREGNTEGIHSMQGSTQRRGCMEVGVESDFDLIAVQALYRPSGTRTGNDERFVARKHGREEWESINPFVGKFLDETYGFAIYQEQIMEMGSAMGMSGIEVDDLYKAIKTAKGTGRGAEELFDAFEPTFRTYAKRIMSRADADELWAMWHQLQGYCVVGDTVVERAGRGQYGGGEITVKQLHDIWHGPATPTRKKYRNAKKGLHLVSWRDGAIHTDRCVDIICNGEKQVWKVTLADGKSITATKNHPLLTDAGWITVGVLKLGDKVVIDTGEIEPHFKPSGEGMGWTGTATKRAEASDGRMRPVLHGNDAGLRAASDFLEDRCFFCGAEDVNFERAHLNHDRSDNTPENLVNACNSCHKKHDYATGQRKGRWKRGRIAGLSEIVSIVSYGAELTYDLVMEGEDHNFVANGIVAHNTFNRGHASSYALLAMKMAWLKCHHPKEFFTALLNRYPGNPRYVAGAIAEGFTFDPPDVNVGTGGFSRGESDNSIRVGLLKVDRVGKGTASEIVRNQPYTSVEDLDERTSNTAVNKTVIDNLKRIGAFECFGIKGDSDDLTDYKLLKFTLRKPRAFKGCKPQVKATGGGGTWQFLGLQRGVQMTEGKSFCAKLFWVLPLDMNETFVTKTSASGKYNAHLLTVVDENGLPMDLKVADDKAAESGLIKLLAEHGGGAVICAEGRVQMPFVRGGNTTFQFWGIAGAERENPQIWHVSSAMAKAVSRLAKQKENRRSK